MMEQQSVSRPRGRPPLQPREPIAAAVRSRDTAISRFTLQDMPEWGDWLIKRLSLQWPGNSDAAWRGKIANITGSNEFLFVKNADSLMLVHAPIHALDGIPRGMEIFCWSTKATALDEKRMGVPYHSEDEYSLLSLYRFARDWSRQRGAKYMIVGICTDCTISSLEGILKGECADWVVVK